MRGVQFKKDGLHKIKVAYRDVVLSQGVSEVSSHFSTKHYAVIILSRHKWICRVCLPQPHWLPVSLLSLSHTHITCCFKMFYLPLFDVLLLIGFSSSLCSSLSCICTLMLCLIHMRWTHSRCKRKPDSKSAFLAVYGLFAAVSVKQTPKSLLKTVKKTMHTWIGAKCIHLYHVFIFRGTNRVNLLKY